MSKFKKSVMISTCIAKWMGLMTLAGLFTVKINFTKFGKFMRSIRSDVDLSLADWSRKNNVVLKEVPGFDPSVPARTLIADTVRELSKEHNLEDTEVIFAEAYKELGQYMSQVLIALGEEEDLLTVFIANDLCKRGTLHGIRAFREVSTFQDNGPDTSSWAQA